METFKQADIPLYEQDTLEYLKDYSHSAVHLYRAAVTQPGLAPTLKPVFARWGHYQGRTYRCLWVLRWVEGTFSPPPMAFAFTPDHEHLGLLFKSCQFFQSEKTTT